MNNKLADNPTPGETEYLLYGLAAGDTESWQEQLLLTTKVKANIERVKKLAVEDGFHSFREAEFHPGELPDFANTVNL